MECRTKYVNVKLRKEARYKNSHISNRLAGSSSDFANNLNLKFCQQLFARYKTFPFDRYILKLSAIPSVRRLAVCLKNSYDVKASEFQSDLPSQVNPSPLYPGRHVHKKLPTVLLHVAAELQPPLSVSHSSISKSSQVKME